MIESSADQARLTWEEREALFIAYREEMSNDQDPMINEDKL